MQIQSRNEKKKFSEIYASRARQRGCQGCQCNRPVKGPLTDLQVVQYAYKFFETFKGTVAHLIFSFLERDLSQDFFIAISGKNSWSELVGEDGQAGAEIVEKEK